MGKRTLITIVGLAIPIALLLLFHRQINDFHNKTEGVAAAIALVVSIYLWIAQYYYLKSERFYLWVQRQLLKVRRTHTFWRFTIRYVSDPLFDGGESRIPALQQRIFDAFPPAFGTKPLTDERLENAMTVTVDDVDRFEVTFDIDENELVFHTGKMRVPSDLYDDHLDTLVALFNGLERAVRPHKTAYRLELTFNHNPYFGFFVRHVPEKLLNHFRCSFQSSIDSDCRVEATKEAIYLDCNSNASLSQVVRGYLSLSEQLITRGSSV